jgi:hypothetical protein
MNYIFYIIHNQLPQRIQGPDTCLPVGEKGLLFNGKPNSVAEDNHNNQFLVPYFENICCFKIINERVLEIM